jgi:hypothetical protein
MKRLLVFVALVLCTGLASCQCADQPDVGPVEDEDEQAHRILQDDRPASERIA